MKSKHQIVPQTQTTKKPAKAHLTDAEFRLTLGKIDAQKRQLSQLLTNFYLHLTHTSLAPAYHPCCLIRKDLSRKDAKAQSAAAFLNDSLCAFASLREKNLLP